MSNADMSLTDRVKNELQDRVKAARQQTGSTTNNVPKVEEPWFKPVTAISPEDGTVMLSTLVPNWKKLKNVSDVRVKLHMLSEYDENAKARIPEIDSFYRPNLKALSQLAYAIENTESSTLLTGPASVGKSSLVQYYCAITNRPFFRFNYNGTMDSSSLLGTMSASNGSTQWHDGLIAEAIQVPNAVILNDEWTLCPAEVMMAQQYLLEPNGKLLLPDKPGNATDKFIKPAPGVRFVFADNTKGNGDPTGKYVGTQPQNNATLDRIGTFIYVDFLNQPDEVAMLKARFPEATDKLMNAMVQVANLCRTSYNQGGLNVQLSSRVLVSWITHSMLLQDYEQALEIAYLNRFDSDAERQTVEGFVRTVFGS